MNKKQKKIFQLTIGVVLFLIIINKTIPNNKTKGKNLVIGDSHAVMIGAKLNNAKADNLLSKSGWNISNLLNALSNYPVSNDVSNVIISIGTNSGYNKNDKIEYLINQLKQKFPKSKFYIFKGSFGWSGKYENKNAVNDLIPYYDRFAKMGVKVLKNGLGYFKTDSAAHSTTSNQAKAIINEINSII